MSNLILRKFALEHPYYSTLHQDKLADCLPKNMRPIERKEPS